MRNLSRNDGFESIWIVMDGYIKLNNFFDRLDYLPSYKNAQLKRRNGGNYSNLYTSVRDLHELLWKLQLWKP